MVSLPGHMPISTSFSITAVDLATRRTCPPATVIPPRLVCISIQPRALPSSCVPFATAKIDHIIKTVLPAPIVIRVLPEIDPAPSGPPIHRGFRPASWPAFRELHYWPFRLAAFPQRLREPSPHTPLHAKGGSPAAAFLILPDIRPIQPLHGLLAPPGASWRPSWRPPAHRFPTASPSARSTNARRLSPFAAAWARTSAMIAADTCT